MKTAVHTQSVKSTKQLSCLSLLITGALLLTVVCLPATVAKASTVAQIEAMATASTVSLSNAVITEVLSNPNIVSNGVTSNNWAFLVNDGSSGSATGNYSGGPVGGSLEIFVSKANGVGLFGANTPTVGDTISMNNAKWSPFNGIPEVAFITGSTYSRTSQNPSYIAPAPVPVTLDGLSALTTTGVGLDFTTLGYYTTLSNVLIRNPSPVLNAPDGSSEWDYGTVGGTASSSFNTQATLVPGPGNTSTNNVTGFDFQSSYQGEIANLGGQIIPTGPVDITGIVDVFTSGPEFLPFAVTPHIFTLPSGSQFWKPSTVGGSGTWDNSSSSWNTAADGSGTNAVYSSSKFTVFGGTQATSNVQIAHGGVTANGIDFASNGYTISGADATATLTIGATNTIDAVNLASPSAVITANITAQLAGSSGVNINGAFFNPGVIKLNPTAGSENFSGDLTLSAGTLEVPTLSTLGTAFLGSSTSVTNKLFLNGGGLKIDTAGTYTLFNAVRGASASALDLPTGSTLNIAGVTSDSAVGANAPTLTLPNAITLNLTDSGSTTFNENVLHGLTFGAAAGGGIVNTSSTGGLGIHYIVSNSTSGVNTVNGNVDFGAYTSNSGDFILSSDSTSTGTLVITGNVSANAQEIFITGSGVLDMQGNNSNVNYTASSTGASIAIGGFGSAGPTVNIHNTTTLGAGHLDIVNSGTLNNVSGSALTFPTTLGLSIGSSATSGASETFAGNNLEFQGPVSFFKATGASNGYLGITVNNTTTFSGGLQADASGTGTPLGVVLRGSGILNISNKNGGAMSNALPLIVSGGLKVNIGADSTGTAAGTAFTAVPDVQVEQGTMTTKIASAFASTTSLILGDPSFGGGGTFATNGTVQSLNYLDLQATSAIDLGNAGSISFTASSSTNSATAVLPGSTVAANAWASGAILRVNHWQASDPLKIGTSAGLTTPEKAAIHFQGYLTGSQQAVDGTVTPIGSQVLFLGDANQDAGHHVDASDISAMEAALTNLNGYETAHSFDVADMLDVLDINGDGTFNGADVQAFLTYLKTGHGSNAAVPEPSSIVLGLLGVAGLATMARRRSKQIAA